MAHEELIARLRSMNTVTGDWAARELEAADRQAEADRARIAELEKTISVLVEVQEPATMGNGRLQYWLSLQEQLAAANQRIADWERRSESCESKLGQLEANEALIEANQREQALLQRVKELRKVGQAVVDRWETPLWKDAPATAGFIYALRDALATKDDFSRLEDQA